jgi:uncharacterized membrane protein
MVHTIERQVAQDRGAPPSSKLPGLLLGVGLGGFVDGIVMHQVLQWHHLLSDHGDFPAGTLEGLEGNVVADGLFHAATWVFLLAGSLVTVRAWQRRELAPPWRAHAGWLLVGWGVFNLVEGVVDHHLLGIHHVRDDLGGPLAWDVGFLVFGALLVAVGLALGTQLSDRPEAVRSRARHPDRTDRSGGRSRR